MSATRRERLRMVLRWWVHKVRIRATAIDAFAEALQAAGVLLLFPFALVWYVAVRLVWFPCMLIWNEVRRPMDDETAHKLRCWLEDRS